MTLAESVHEALVRLEAAERWLRHVEAGECDTQLAEVAVDRLVADARTWLEGSPV